MRIAQIFGLNLRRLRKAAKISQRMMCDDLNVSAPTLIRWEKGENMPREEGQIDELAAYLNVEPEALFERPHGDKPTESASVGISKKEALELVNQLAAEGSIIIKLKPKK